MDRVIEGTVWEKIKKWSKGVDSVVSTNKNLQNYNNRASFISRLVNVALTLDM